MNTNLRTKLAALGLAIAIASSAANAAPFRGTAADSGLVAAITVTGHSELQVKPDIAYASLQVLTQDRDQSVAVASNATRSQAVIDILRKSMIDDKDIQTESYMVQPAYDYRVTPAVLTGYQVTNSVRVTIRNIAKAGLIVDKATTAGANVVNGISFDLADRSKSQGIALIEAVRNARSKAELVAGAAGINVGRVLSLTEGTAPTIQPVMYAKTAMAMTADAAPQTPIQSQDITVSADVTVSYGIEYPVH